MTTYAILCLLAALALCTSLVANRLKRLQETIAITGLALLISLFILLVGKVFHGSLYSTFVVDLKQLEFKELLLDGMLGFLLFAGALQIHFSILKKQRWEIFFLAFVGTLISTFVIGGIVYYVAQFIGHPLAFIYCLLFGSLISPTDPIAVLAIIKSLGAPDEVSIQVEGESLFNDGIGLVIFVSLSKLAFSTTPLTTMEVVGLFMQEAVGGIVFGGVLAYGLYRLLKLCDDSTQFLLISALVPSAGYVLADMLGVSGPLAMVSAGIIVGNFVVPKLTDETSSEVFEHFWLLIESFLNSLLFLLLGLLLLLVEFDKQLWWFMLLAVPIVLVGRTCGVYIPYFFFRRFKKYNSYAERILVWGGLRGGLAFAMAMSLPTGVMLWGSANIDLRELIMVMTYAVVLFSILVQGSTVTGFINKSNEEDARTKSQQ
ncbi:cation:proton antiporter [Paraferrimonas haliotis]|uniref:Sodium:proton antiporter n=1 Tax=Paraferrimonas haliotis TaxID=2013866 RepID=A0AA37WXR8_9GAMM|nr:sodium:proton antiporter [Paraferrimonas haliotis]GLS82895.1 sodium:proton antiporter [Paraferrimonas haliotis]